MQSRPTGLWYLVICRCVATNVKAAVNKEEDKTFIFEMKRVFLNIFFYFTTNNEREFFFFKGFIIVTYYTKQLISKGCWVSHLAWKRHNTTVRWALEGVIGVAVISYFISLSNISFVRSFATLACSQGCGGGTGPTNHNPTLSYPKLSPRLVKSHFFIDWSNMLQAGRETAE